MPQPTVKLPDIGAYEYIAPKWRSQLLKRLWASWFSRI
jgi:hypothetical protein